MIKFIRKFQLLILVVGGSLLMVVFLLQPILTRLSPSAQNTKIATLNDGTKITRGDIDRARAAITLLGRSNPQALGPMVQGGLGLTTESDRAAALHWIMLADHARNAGLIGEAGDGQAWIPVIAERLAQSFVENEARSGRIQSMEQFEQLMNEARAQYIDLINRSAQSAANSMNGKMEDVYRTLAEARGMYRMMSGLVTLPAYSDAGAIAAAERLYDAVAVDAVLIKASTISSGIEDPSEEELQSFFDAYKDQNAAENEYGIGYVQPTRIQLGWITLDKNMFMNAVKVDRVELSKMWQQDRDTYSGDFASEKFELERQYREDQANNMMIEADRIIRSQVLAKTNGIPNREGILQLPDDWDTRYPKLDEIADTVTQRLNEKFNMSLPTIEVNLIGDRWLNQNDITLLDGVGRSSYQVGSRQIPMMALPQFFELEEANKTGLDVQPLLPIVDHAAVDELGNRYYAMVLDVRKAGPSDSIDDAGRERVVDDYKSLQAFELLQTRTEELVGLVEGSGDLASAIDAVMSMSNDENSDRPSVLSQILVRADSVNPGRITSFVDPDLNNESFRDEVIEAARDLDPLADPEAVSENPIAVGVALPGSRSIALAKLIAPRPLTLEEYRLRANQAIQQTAGLELMESGYLETNPFSFESLSERYGLEILVSEDDENM
ncbi:MAG: hypothetical protein ACF8K1_08315 [Phycisphaerales bacterium JB047]